MQPKSYNDLNVPSGLTMVNLTRGFEDSRLSDAGGLELGPFEKAVIRLGNTALIRLACEPTEYTIEPRGLLLPREETVSGRKYIISRLADMDNGLPSWRDVAEFDDYLKITYHGDDLIFPEEEVLRSIALNAFSTNYGEHAFNSLLVQLELRSEGDCNLIVYDPDKGPFDRLDQAGTIVYVPKDSIIPPVHKELFRGYGSNYVITRPELSGGWMRDNRSLSPIEQIFV